MCVMCDELVILITKPYTNLLVVSLPSKSVRERFRTFFDILKVSE